MEIVSSQTNVFLEIASKIIREQELVVGPLAWSEAGKVQGLKIVDSKKGEIVFDNGDQKSVIDRLVNQYDRLFGQASHEVSREAAAPLVADLSPSEVPSSLQ